MRFFKKITKTQLLAVVLTAAFLFAAITTGPVTVYAKGGPSETEATHTPPPIIPVIEEAPPAQPLTPPGTGTVIDNVTNENSIEFFTITSAAGNIFFLIIDRQRDTENVYFLNAVTERDLQALAEEAGDEWVITSTPPPIIPGAPPAPEPDVEAGTGLEPEPVPDPEPEDTGIGMGTIIILILLVIGGGAAGYYFKIYLPKQQEADTEDDFDYGDDDEAGPYSGMEDDSSSWDIDEPDSDKDDSE